MHHCILWVARVCPDLTRFAVSNETLRLRVGYRFGLGAREVEAHVTIHSGIHLYREPNCIGSCIPPTSSAIIRSETT